MKQSAAVSVAVLAMCALTACGSSSKSSTSPSVVSSSPSGQPSSSSAGASPSESASGSVSAAGQQYLSLTASANADLVAFLALPDATPVAQIQAAARKVSTDEVALLGGLKQASWPSGVQAAITTLQTQVAKEQPVFAQAAAAPSLAAIKAVLQQNQATIAARAAAANQVRQALGLPTPSGAPSGGVSTSASA